MKTKLLITIGLFIFVLLPQKVKALSSSDVSIRMISGYFWMDNSCISSGPQGKVVSYRIKNLKGSTLQGVTVTLNTITFTATGGTSYSSGTPSFLCRTSTSVYVGNIAAGDSATAFFFVGYNCLMYPNNTNLTTDYITLPATVADNLPGTVTQNFTTPIYVLRNANNNTITVLATSTNAVGTLVTISIAYAISNVKPNNIIDMELSTTSTFPAGYEIMGCVITASTITSDFPVGERNTHFKNATVSNLPSGGTVTLEWTLKITGTSTGLTSSNIIPFVVSDAGSAQRWQANTTSFTGTSTPTNPLLISKRVNTNYVLPSDTVTYTIVIRNTSTTADITIDRLVDNLPRDYRFRYMETNTGVYSKLVTYNNCTQYPAYNALDLMNFYGTKEVSAGVFSWLIPRTDSIKLIYSVTVSATTGLRDTNVVDMYVGSSKVGTARAGVNVVAVLPLKLLYFNAEKKTNDVQLNWATSEFDKCCDFSLYKQASNGVDFVKIADIPASLPENSEEYVCTDVDALADNVSYLVYKLVQDDNEGQVKTYTSTIDINQYANDFSVYQMNKENVTITTAKGSIRSINVTLTDALGRVLYSGTVEKINGQFIIPYNFGNLQNNMVFVTIEQSGWTGTKKVLVN
ncbi:MAG: hypothetical protein V4613_01945 [Bacteroidota bacterium]